MFLYFYTILWTLFSHCECETLVPSFSVQTENFYIHFQKYNGIFSCSSFTPFIMSQIPNENDDNRSVAASDFVKVEPPDEVPDQQEEQPHQGQSQFGLHQSLDSTLDTGSTHNDENGFKEVKWMMANLQAHIVWNRSKTNARISECGLILKENATSVEWVRAIATEGYAISGEHCRKENFPFPGTIVFYYEVTTSDNYWYSVGFTDGSKPFAPVGGSPNSYGIAGYDAKIDTLSLWLSEKEHKLECPTGVTARRGNVLGSGLLLNSKNELAVLFTLDGILLVKQTPINPTVDRLYPTVSIYDANVEANFGNNLAAKPFKFDIGKCPELVFE